MILVDLMNEELNSYLDSVSEIGFQYKRGEFICCI
jgi:hypothetical protein